MGKGLHVGGQEFVNYADPILHDINALTLYGDVDPINYEVRNHDGKILMMSNRNLLVL